MVTLRLMQPGQVISISLAALFPRERILQALSSGHSWKEEMGHFIKLQDELGVCWDAVPASAFPSARLCPVLSSRAIPVNSPQLTVS